MKTWQQKLNDWNWSKASSIGIVKSSKDLESLENLIEQIEQEARADERAKVLADFAEYCHTKYLGSGKSHPNQLHYEYSYETEVACMVDEYLKLKELK